MAVTRRNRRRTGSRMKTRGRRTVRRRAGAFGLYRSTRFASLRSVARRLGRVSSIVRSPFPQTKLVRHKYVDTITVPAGFAAGGATVYQFRANSVYDPDFTGTGHQPMFHDEMALQYKRYTVLRSTIVLEAAGTNTQELNFLLWCDDDITTPSLASPNTAMEQHGSKLDRLDRRSFPMKIKAWYDAAKWHKTSRNALVADDTQRTPSGNNPASAAEKFFTLYVAPLSGSVTVSALTMKVTMYFETLWSQPVDHAGS